MLSTAFGLISPRRRFSRTLLSNGLDWSPYGRTFYFTDSSTRRIDAYDIDLESAGIRNGRMLVGLPHPVATPGGMAVDAEGTIWVAMWDGGCVHRFDPDGRLLLLSEPWAAPGALLVRPP
ncbi:hypothetical protein SCMU_05880 [Sinomonas cyclohexanicum]|uniref:SMP-30/Gluconolactonase/LRE-like region domain-containing protein n=1 Tax=Sinomonas cyclohexanicum TaxID=322009 RepID=A0ABM7PRB1_SINCY|nr:SMP-30/gluconolactonase/LRE family protein [Corynebacterium cyclohexanicum]BCT74746.1 hypothetical protein SCMU_05880 [Corynebacterium cyclohexanicum]